MHQPAEHLHAVSPTVAERGDIPLAEYVGVLWSSRWKIVAVTLLAAIVTFVFCSLLTPTYEAETTLLVSQAKIGEQQSELSLKIGTFRAIIANHRLAADVVRELNLVDPPMFWWQGSSGQSMTSSQFLRTRLSVDQVGDTNLIRIRARMSDPKVAAQVANALVVKAVALNRELNQREVVGIRDYIKMQVDETFDRLQTLKTELLQFKEKAQVELVKKDAEAALAERGKLVGVLIDIEAERARLTRAREELAKRQPTMTVTRSIDRDSALAEVARTANANANAGTQSILGLQMRDEQLNDVYGALEKEMLLSETKLAGLEQQRVALVQKYGLGGERLPRLTALYSKEIELARLQADYDLVGKLYNDLTSKYEQARIQVASRSTELQVVDPALEPTSRIAPQRSATTGMALLGAFLATCAFIWLFHYVRLHASHHVD